MNLSIPRPDLSQVDPVVRNYIEALEAELVACTDTERAKSEPPNGSEPPTTLNVLTLSAAGVVKRTPRHLYQRQLRGGMGVFDLEVINGDAPAQLLIADEQQHVVWVTNRSRAFRMAVQALPAAPVHARGQTLPFIAELLPNERVVCGWTDVGSGYLVLLSARGHVRLLRHHMLGASLIAGTPLYAHEDFGDVVAACWSPGESDLFIATRQGQAIRFSEKTVPTHGCLGIRVEPGDAPVAIAAVRADSGVFLLGADGKGTIRLMEGFSANKSPAGGGKLALKTERLIGIAATRTHGDIFIISRQAKLIRFHAEEVPAKEGLVQGVHCIALRSDEAAALVVANTTV